MDDVVFSFPLLQLPSNAQLNVISNMKLIEQLCISTLSKRTTNLVKSLNLKADRICVMIGYVVRIAVSFEDWTTLQVDFSYGNGNLFDDYPLRYGNRGLFYVNDSSGVQPDLQRWRNLRYNIREWINHFQEIFHKPKIDELSFITGINKFEINSLRMTIQGLNIQRLELSYEGSYNYSQMIISTFNLCKFLTVERTPFQDVNKVLMGNFISILLGASWSWTLDHLLICNASDLSIRSSNFSDELLNQFLKHWTEGSNSRMESMRIEFRRSFDPNIIFKGLKHRVVPPNETRDCGGYYIRGGFDIKRKTDGMMASIRLEDKNEAKVEDSDEDDSDDGEDEEEGWEVEGFSYFNFFVRE